ncbi:MAG: hypothetical protein GTN93_21470 [Anaerolineae bacterium]|nr:hypothetical protein [Anaerolineae bacterium]
MIWTAIPTWFLTNLFTPFLPKSHKWHGRYFTLRDWHRGRTELTVQFDFVFWMGAVGLFMLGYWITGSAE